MSIAKHIQRQKYALRCRTLDADSHAFDYFLKTNTALQDEWSLKAVAPGAPLRAVLSHAGSPGTFVTVAEGRSMGPIRAVKVSPKVVVLTLGVRIAVLTP